jgi:simple sugar transport system permease protein
MSRINLKNIKIGGTTLQLIGINIVIFVIFSVLRPSRFPTITNFGSMGFQFPEFGFFTLGIALAMLTGGIDLSIVAVGNLVATITGFILLNRADATGFSAVSSILLCVLLAVLIGIVCGCLNGALVAILGISPILATLGTQNLYTGICMVLTGGKGVFGKFPAALTFIGSGSLFGFIPMPLFLFLIALVLFYIIIHRTPYGFKTQWYGSNNKVSFYSGINNVKTVFITYVFSAILGAVTGILILARTNTAKYDYGVTYVLQALLVSVLAGVSPEGGKGNIFNILFSVFAIQMLDSGFNFMRISSFVRSSTYGALLIISVALEFLIRRYRLKKEVKRAEAAAREIH